MTIPNSSQSQFQPIPLALDQAMSIRALTKTFGQKIAVNNLNLDIPVGSFYGLVGPNGAGKTTTLTMATGLLRPTQGQITVLGTPVWPDSTAAKKLMGIMPESDQLFDRLTGLQLIVYAGMLQGLNRATGTKRANDLLQALDLMESANIIVADYSTGMTKKIALATALVHSPRVLVLDEPLEAVDPVSAVNIRTILTSYVQGGGTVIMSSHVMALVEQVCSHVAIISNGQVLVNGTLDEVRAGGSLEDRFVNLVGGRHDADNLEWLSND